MWSKLPAPEIAVKYWELGPNAMMRDVILGTIHKPHGQIFGILPPALPLCRLLLLINRVTFKIKDQEFH